MRPHRACPEGAHDKGQGDLMTTVPEREEQERRTKRTTEESDWKV